VAENHPEPPKNQSELVKATLDAAKEAQSKVLEAQAKVTALQTATNSEVANAAVTAMSLAVSNLALVAERATEAAERKLIVSISVQSQFSDSEKRQPYVDAWQQIYAAAIFGIAVLFILNDWSAKNGPNALRWWYGVIPIALIDGFLILLLNAAVKRGSSTKEKFPFIPNRGAALRTLTLFYFAFVLLFAHLNWDLKLTTSRSDALYEGFLTVLRLDPIRNVGDSVFNRWLVAGELLSVVLLFFVFFPLLVARLALFEGETVSVKNLKAACKDANLAERLSITLTVDSPVHWYPSNISGDVLPDEKTAVLQVDEQGAVKISKGVAPA
jgi:hypothetical protein